MFGRNVHPTSSRLCRINISLLALVAAASLSIPSARAQDEENVHDEMFKSAKEVPYYPSATECAQCHPDHFREWAVSPHAYAQMSPVFNAMQATILRITNGTNGDFCIRCHTPVGMALNEPINMSNLDRHPAAREGVTCVTCHRVNQAWGKGAGRLALVVGGINSPVYGPRIDK